MLSITVSGSIRGFERSRVENQYDAVRTVAGSSTLTRTFHLELVKEAFREGFTEGVDRWRKGKLNRVAGMTLEQRLC